MITFKDVAAVLGKYDTTGASECSACVINEYMYVYVCSMGVKRELTIKMGFAQDLWNVLSK